MKKLFFCLLPFLHIFVLFTSCEEKESFEKTDSLMPIESGNSWTYKYTISSEHATISNSFKYTIGEKLNINGYSCFIKEIESPLGVKSDIHRDELGNIILFDCAYLIGNDNSGSIVQYGGISDVDTLIIPSIEFNRNAQVGDEWVCSQVTMDWNSETFIESTKTITCISVDTLINTPKGDFHCMGFETSMNSSTLKMRRYYSINVGEVRAEAMVDGNIQSYTELIDYSLESLN